MCFDICTINIRVSIRVRGLYLVRQHETSHVSTFWQSYELWSFRSEVKIIHRPSCSPCRHRQFCWAYTRFKRHSVLLDIYIYTLTYIDSILYPFISHELSPLYPYEFYPRFAASNPPIFRLTQISGLYMVSESWWNGSSYAHKRVRNCFRICFSPFWVFFNLLFCPFSLQFAAFWS